MSQDNIYYVETPESRKYRLGLITQKEIERQEEIKRQKENGSLPPPIIVKGDLNYQQLRYNLNNKKNNL